MSTKNYKNLGQLMQNSKKRIQKLKSNQNIPAVQPAESQKSHKEHKQEKDMFSCSDCDKKSFLKTNFLRTTLKPDILKIYRITKKFDQNVQNRIHR